MINLARQLVLAGGALVVSAGLAAAAPAVVATDLNVRSGQGTGYPVIGTMQGGSVVEVRGCGDGWCYIPAYGGFASARYLDAGGAYAAAPVYVAPPVYRSSGVSFGIHFGDRPRHHWRHRHHRHHGRW